MCMGGGGPSSAVRDQEAENKRKQEELLKERRAQLVNPEDEIDQKTKKERKFQRQGREGLTIDLNDQYKQGSGLSIKS
tara:strand:- start:209 stop:442 length:234 start_codon:yes stop_codon:yes gene_type:complete